MSCTSQYKQNRRTDGQMDRRTDGPMDRPTDRQTDRQTDGRTDRWIDGHLDDAAIWHKLIVAKANPTIYKLHKTRLLSTATFYKLVGVFQIGQGAMCKGVRAGHKTVRAGCSTLRNMPSWSAVMLRCVPIVELPVQ